MNRYKLFKAGVDVNNALKRLNNDKELYELYKKVFEQNKDKILLLLSDIPNKRDALRQGELGPLLRNANQMLIFYDLDKLEIMNLNTKGNSFAHSKLKDDELYFKCGDFLGKYRIALK